MKKLRELGISPTPWTNKLGNGKELNSVWDARNGEILSGGYVESVNDARLIASATKLYDAAERLLRFDEERCIRGNMVPEEITRAYNKAKADLKAALAEASGEREENQ